jgi:hypothetical protein
LSYENLIHGTARKALWTVRRMLAYAYGIGIVKYLDRQICRISRTFSNASMSGISTGQWRLHIYQSTWKGRSFVGLTVYEYAGNMTVLIING